MEETTKAVFDAAKLLVVPILSGGEKSCEVRFPSDEEWCSWARAQRTCGTSSDAESRRARTLACQLKQCPTRNCSPDLY